MSEFIEVLSPEGKKALDDFIAKLQQGEQAVKSINAAFAQTKVPSDVRKTIEKTNDEIAKSNKLKTEAEKLDISLAKAQEKYKLASSASAKEIQKLRGETNRLNRDSRETGILTSKLASEYEKLSARMNKTGREIQNLVVKKEQNGRLSKAEELELRKLQQEYNKYNTAITRADVAINKHNRNVGNYGSALGKMTGILRTTIAAFGIYSGFQIARDIFSEVKEIDGLNKALKKVTETQGLFNKAQSFLINLADEAGVELNGLTKSYTKFLASAKTTNLSLAETENIFRQTAKAGAVLGLSTDDINGTFRALEQILSKGKVQAEEIRGQLGERLPGAFQILAQSMGLTTQELSKQLELGNVISDEVLPKFAEELEKVYGLDTVNKVQTLQAETNRLSTQWTLFLKSFEDGEGTISSFFAVIIRELTNTVKFWTKLNKDMFKVAEATAYAREIKEIRKQAELTGEAEKDIAARRVSARRETERILQGQISAQEKIVASLKEETNWLERQAGLSAAAKRLKAAEDQLKLMKGSLSVTKGQITALMELTTEQEKNNEAVKKGVNEAVKGSIAWLEKQIKTLENLRDTTALTEEQYKSWSEQIEAAKFQIEQITGAVLKFSDAMDGLSLEDAFEILDTPEVIDTAEVDGIIAKGQKALEVQKRIAEQQKRALADLAANIPDAFNLGLGEAFNDILKANAIEIDENASAAERFALQMERLGHVASAVGGIMIGVFSRITEAQNASIDIQIDKLAQQKEIELAFAGDSAAARGEIEERFARDKKKLQQEQARNSKKLALIEATVNIATAVIKALAAAPPPLNFILASIVGALGAAQIAVIASTPIPEFKEGVRNFEGGKAIVGDGGVREVITTSKGAFLTPDKPTLVDLPRGASVYKNEQEFRDSLNGVLSDNHILPSKVPNVVVRGNELTAAEIGQQFERVLSKRPTNIVTIDKNGISAYTLNQFSKITSKNNRVTFKGKNV